MAMERAPTLPIAHLVDATITGLAATEGRGQTGRAAPPLLVLLLAPPAADAVVAARMVGVVDVLGVDE